MSNTARTVGAIEVAADGISAKFVSYPEKLNRLQRDGTEGEAMSGMKPLPCPCPWCGGTKVCAAMRRKLRYFVVCEGIECSAEGPTKNTAREAIREWNRVAAKAEALRLLVADIRSLGSPPEQLLVALAKAEEALGTKP